MIEFKNIEIKYGDFVAVKDLNLTVKEGEFFTLLGPSGCGKTTILRSLVGFEAISGGDIYVNGKNITKVPIEDRGIGIVFQNYALFPTLSVYENIAFGLKVKKVSKTEIDKLVAETAKEVDLDKEHLFKKVSELSGGQQQRVAIARALIMKPNILVLDEPLSNLDARLRVQLRSELKSLQRELKVTTIYVTHDQEEALTLSDRIAVFNKGIVEQMGTPKDIYDNSATEFVCNFIGDINKLDKGIIEKINKQTSKSIELSKKVYVREEKVFMTNKPDSSNFVSLKARILNIEYYGIYNKYTFEIDGSTVRNIEIDDGLSIYSIGDKVELFINPDHILQY